jgi:hypothetical protein
MDDKIGEIIDNKKTGGPNGPSNREVLDYVGLLRSFFASVGLFNGTAEFQSFCALVDLISALADISKAGTVDDDAILRTFAKDPKELSEPLMALHVRTNGGSHAMPKHHWLLHVWSQLLRDRCLLNSFVVERLVRRSKTACKNICCTQAFEKTAAQTIFVRSLNYTGHDSSDRVMGRTGRSTSGLPTTLDATNEFGEKFSSGEMVLAGGHVAQIQFFAKKREGHILAMLDVCDLVGVRQFDSVVKPTGVWTAVRLRNLVPAIAWLHLPGGDIAVVHVGNVAYSGRGASSV